MNILVQNPTEAILNGITNVLSTLGDTIIIWDNNNIPLNDLLDQYNPDIVFGYTQTLPNIDICPKSKLVTIGEPAPKTTITINQTTHTIEPAANPPHKIVTYDSNYATDIFYYSENTSSEDLIYLQYIEQNYQLKVIGQHRIPLTSYLGAGTTDDINKFMKSCKIALGFTLSSVYDYAINKVFCLTNQKNQILHEDSQFATLIELDNRLNFLLSDSTDAKEQIIADINNAYEYVISNHTYFHRTHKILTLLGYTEQAEQCLVKLQQTAQ